MTGYKLIWGKSVVEGKANRRTVAMHTISAPNVHEVYDGFVRQFPPGTPWRLVAPDGSTAKEGTA